MAGELDGGGGAWDECCGLGLDAIVDRDLEDSRVFVGVTAVGRVRL